jgi:hypothetical protein
MKRMTIATILAIVGTASVASARRLPAPIREYASPTVTNLSTYQLGRTMYRAISGIEGRRPFLVLEELGWQSRNWRDGRGRGRDPRETGDESITADDAPGADLRDRYDDRQGRRGTLVVRVQRQISAVDIGRQRIEMTRFRYLTVEGWNNNRLTFSAATSRKAYRCAVNLTDGTGAVCEGTWTEDGYDGGGINPGGGPVIGPGGGYDGGGINPAPGGGNAGDLERLKVATKGCGEAFYDTALRDNCIQIVIRSNVELLPAVSACNQAIASAADKLGCVTQASTFRGDAAAAVKQCAKSFYGTQEMMNCFRTVVTQSLPLAVIPACESAVYGNQDRVRCMNAVAGSRTEPVALIAYCKENNAGTEKILSCIARYK